MSHPATPMTWMHQIDRHAAMLGDRPALRCCGATTTWAQLADRTRRLAHGLAEHGVGEGDRVALLLTNRPEYLEAVVAVNRLGAIAVPVNFRLTPAEIGYILADSGARVVLSEPAQGLDDRAAVALADLDHPVTHLRLDSEDPATGYEPLLARSAATDLPWPSATERCALIMYTSGTTGHPKGAMLSYRNLEASAAGFLQSYELVGPDEVCLVTSPIFHIAAMAMALPCFLWGITVAITPTGAFAAEEFLDLVEAERVTAAFLVPTAWQDVVDSPTLAGRDLRLHTVAWGAAPATPALLRSLSEVFPGVKVLCLFGQTEMSPTTTNLRGEDAIRKLGSVGTPLPLVQVRVVDTEGNDVAPGEIGEIVYRGPTVMLGYWNKPEATEEAFAGGWFHSGDLVRQDEDGFLYVVDRLKDMIISGGENIYCAEVEGVIADHPAVLEAALVARPHERWGETPVAFVTARDPQTPPVEAEIIAWCQERLASYKKPSAVVVVDELPRNAAGKVLKGDLRARAVDGV